MRHIHITKDDLSSFVKEYDYFTIEEQKILFNVNTNDDVRTKGNKNFGRRFSYILQQLFIKNDATVNLSVNLVKMISEKL